jgi:hypothetical protein
MKIVTLIFSVTALMNTNMVLAEALPIEPGLWEITTTNTNPMTGKKDTQVIKECMTEDKFDPIAMMNEDESCRVTEDDLDGNTLTFTLNCNMEGGESTMQGVYQIEGDHGKGNMKMEFSFGGQTMTSESNTEARRISDC